MRVSVLLFVLLLCVGGAQASVSRQTLDWTLTPAQVQTAQSQLASLTVKAAGPMVTYQRDNFGAHGRTRITTVATPATTSSAATSPRSFTSRDPHAWL